MRTKVTPTVVAVAVQFRRPWHRGNSMLHTSGHGTPWDESMEQRGVIPNPGENPSEQSWIWLREKPVPDPPLHRDMQNGVDHA
jgi:hypothetical protein